MQFRIAAAFAFLVGCSSVQTTPSSALRQAVNSDERFQLLVRTGNSTMDQLLY